MMYLIDFIKEKGLRIVIEFENSSVIMTLKGETKVFSVESFSLESSYELLLAEVKNETFQVNTEKGVEFIAIPQTFEGFCPTVPLTRTCKNTFKESGIRHVVSGE